MLLGPHGVDRYTELVDPMWTSESRARVTAVRRGTPNSVTLWLAPNRPIPMRAGQHVGLTVEIDGRRHTRCYSPANGEGAAQIELTIARRPGGLVSEYLYRAAHVQMVVGLGTPAGDFVLPESRPRRLLAVAGGSGITPVMAMARTLRSEGFSGEVAVLHYVPTVSEACYRAELAAMPGVRAVHVPTRGGAASDSLRGRLTDAHLESVMAEPDAVYVCGPADLVDAVRSRHPGARAESFSARPSVRPTCAAGGRIAFRDSGIEVVDSGQPLLEQAEAAGLQPQSGCRMGICHTCTRRKLSGAVRNLNTGAVSTAGDSDIQICVSVPVGDVEIAL